MSLKGFAKKHGVEVIDNGGGHIQLKGLLLVSYYPNSKKKTAYIAGTSGSSVNVSPEAAVMMAITIPKGARSKRLKSYKAAKNRLLMNNPYCCWCKMKLTKETATIEHIIPLARGGLNNHNNYALACEPCNTKRGCDMPELTK